MASNYPGSLDTFTTKTDKQDDYAAAHMNDVQNAIVAAQTEMGVNPAGSLTDVVTRLDYVQDSDGALAKGSAFPVSGLVDGQVFYRTDQNTLYVYNGSSWDSQGQSLSNVLFSWSSTEVYSANNWGYFVDPTSLLETAPTGFSYIGVKGTTYKTMLQFQFAKISGISTVTINARLWAQTTNGGAECICNVDIGGQANTVKSVASTTPTWVTTSDIDVSGLSDGTVYDGIIQLKNETTEFGYCSGITLVGS